MTQVAQLQSDIDAAYRECFESVSRDLHDEMGSAAALEDITEASFGNLGRANSEVHYILAFTTATVPHDSLFCTLSKAPQ